MDGQTAADRTDVGRALLVTVLVLLVAAWGCLRGAFALDRAGLAGHAEDDLLGALVLPLWVELGWVAALLGGLTAVVVTAGWARRVVGMLLVAGFVLVPWLAPVAVSVAGAEGRGPGLRFLDRMSAFLDTARTLGVLGLGLLLAAVLLLVVLGHHMPSFGLRAVGSPPRSRWVSPERAVLWFVLGALVVASVAMWLLVPIRATLGLESGSTGMWWAAAGLVMPPVALYTRGPLRRLLGALLVLGVLLPLPEGDGGWFGWGPEETDWYWTALQLQPWVQGVAFVGVLAAGAVLLAVGHRLPPRLRDTRRV